MKKSDEELLKEYQKCKQQYEELQRKYPYWSPYTNRANPLPNDIRLQYKDLHSKLRNLKTTINTNYKKEINHEEL